MTYLEKCSEARDNLYCLTRVLDGKISQDIADAIFKVMLENIALLTPEACTGVDDGVTGD